MTERKKWRKRQIFIPEVTKNIKKVECRVCGKSFYPEAQYIAKDRVITGGVNSALRGNYSDPEKYDAMDCPECRCQLILRKRLDKAE